MTEIIFPQVLKLFINGFLIWFETESDIGENIIQDSNLTVGEERGEAKLGWASWPIGMARWPTLMPIQVQLWSTWFLVHYFLNFMIFAIELCSVVMVCFPHTYF